MLYRVSEIICEQLGLNILVHAQFLQCVKIYYIRSRKLSDECSRYIPISLDVGGELPKGLEFHNLLLTIELFVLQIHAFIIANKNKKQIFKYSYN